MHFLRQPADVMMTLDHLGGIAPDGNAFDHIGIKCALREKFVADVFVGAIMSIFGEQFFRCVLKYFNKLVADNFPFLFGIGHAAQFRKETLAGIDILQTHMKILPENALHISSSRARNNPLFTKMQVSRSPMASCNSAAVTDESTP